MSNQDLINSPPHYTVGTIETIDYIKDVESNEQFEGYCRGNVIKYISRYPHKGGLEDVKKAKVYLDWLIETLERRGKDESRL